MKNRKAILACALVCAAGLCTAGAAVPSSPLNLASVIQADDAVYEGFLYSVNGGKATITGYSEDLNMSDVVIPDVIKDGDNEIPVTAIGEKAFEDGALKTVRGVKGSYAETYAAENNYTFEAVDGDPAVVPSVTPTEKPSEVPSSSPSSVPTAAPDDTRGDVDSDGKITTTDVRKILQYLVEAVQFTDEQKTAADINGDKAVNSTDALLLLRKIAGIKAAE